MSDYIDTYLKSTDYTSISEMCADFVNHIGPIQGSAATTYTTDDGTVLTTSSKGDADCWYAIVRHHKNYTFPYNGVVSATQAECEEVCGAWE